jgi:pyruvate formate lyase activating enzyme
MLIGGLQPVTLLDYPQKLAAIIFTSGCNMRCPFCYNSKLVLPELITAESLYDEKKVVEFLKKRKKYLDGLVITGGEPTLQPDLVDFIRKMKRIGYLIKLDTNGLWPETIADLIKEKLVDYLAIDIKGPLDEYEKFAGVKAGRVAETIKLVIDSGLAHEFRSTLVKGLHKLTDLEKMAKAISGGQAYYLQNYRAEKPLAGDKFNGRAFFDKEMEQARKIAIKYVPNTQIR